MSRNVLLLTAPAPKQSPFPVNEKRPPLGLGFLVSILRRAGHSVILRDEFLQPSRDLTLSLLQEAQVDCVGISVNSVCWSGAMQLLRWLKHIKSTGQWDGNVMVGGPHATLKPEDFLDYADYIVRGEAEQVVVDIVEGSLPKGIISGKPVQDLDRLPRLPWEDFRNLPYDWASDWASAGPVFSLNTSRGCPHRCTFCSAKNITGRRHRYMSPERVLDDMFYLQREYGARCIYFREDSFTASRRRVRELCELLLQKGVELSWMCETRADAIKDRQMVSLMAAAGCEAFYIGVESGSPRILRFLKKDETVEDFVTAFDNARACGIKTYASLIRGVPTEREEDVRATRKLIRRLRPDYIGNSIFVGLPGSELAEYVRENGLYEYEDEAGILYTRAHNQKVNRYNYGNPYRKIPGTTRCWEYPVYNLIEWAWKSSEQLFPRRFRVWMKDQYNKTMLGK